MNTSDIKPNEAFKINGDWNTQSKAIKEKFPQLTDSDLKLEEGKDEELVTRVSTRLNKGREEVINILKKDQPNQK